MEGERKTALTVELGKKFIGLHVWISRSLDAEGQEKKSISYDWDKHTKERWCQKRVWSMANMDFFNLFTAWGFEKQWDQKLGISNWMLKIVLFCSSVHKTGARDAKNHWRVSIAQMDLRPTFLINSNRLCPESSLLGTTRCLHVPSLRSYTVFTSTC